MDPSDERASEQDAAAPRAATITATASPPIPLAQAERGGHASSPGTRAARWRLRMVVVVALLFVIANLGIQLNRRAFDVLSSGGNGLEADLAKIHECESFGRVPDVLYMGSSRAEDGVAPGLIDTLASDQIGRNLLGCNIAMSGSTFASDYFAFKRMVEDGYVPKMIVENVFEFNINANASVATYSPATYHDTWLADLADTPALWQQYAGVKAKLALVGFVAGKLIPLYGDRYGILKVLCHGATLGPCRTALPGVTWNDRDYYTRNPLLGWRPINDVTLADHLTLAQQQALANEIAMFRSDYLRHFQIIDHDPEYLTKIMLLAQQHRVKVVLVVSPLHQLYRDLLAPQQWTAIMAYWQSFAQRHGATFYDQHLAGGYTDADFNDPHHLSVAGAEKFSAWLAVHVVEPGLGTIGG
jgi:hypothetical protein